MILSSSSSSRYSSHYGQPTQLAPNNWAQFALHPYSTDLRFVVKVSGLDPPGLWYNVLCKNIGLLQSFPSLETLAFASLSQGSFNWAVQEKNATGSSPCNETTTTTTAATVLKDPSQTKPLNNSVKMYWLQPVNQNNPQAPADELNQVQSREMDQDYLVDGDERGIQRGPMSQQQQQSQQQHQQHECIVAQSFFPYVYQDDGSWTMLSFKISSLDCFRTCRA
ncbi:hypothetical protein K457DRAFT_17235 [Linnemannia elongata AG-77]|uniref:Uncharacterized protein n=1 Tax=Linnemannia elongata AG-77 TaxID=1314771 RepID=A0A197K2W1_9FUNG|nr:hypothetical protein K457DRAFT_17235 [Linnemannia elongata AG-77]